MEAEIKMCLEETRDSMAKCIENLEKELTKVRAGKANPTMLNGIQADAYGASTPLNQMANITTSDSKTINIQPWDKSLVENIEKAILEANIGITPQNDGETIRLFLPPLTEERRKDLVKQVKTIAENNKVSLRNIRQKSNDQVKSMKNDGLSEDMARTVEAKIQDLINDFSTKIDKLISAKEADIMSV